MALTLGTGPFGKQRTGTFNFDTSVLKAHTLYFEDSQKRVRAVFNGETIVDSRRVRLLHETGHLPVYYFPEEDIRQDLLEPTDHTTHCPFKGEASYRSVTGSRRTQCGTIRSWRSISRRWPVTRRSTWRRWIRDSLSTNRLQLLFRAVLTENDAPRIELS